MDIDIWDVIAAYLCGEALTEDERQKLEKWLDGQDHRRELERLAGFYRENADWKEKALPEPEKGWKENCRRMEIQKRRRKLRQLAKWGYAAAVVLLVSVGGILVLNTGNHDKTLIKVAEENGKIVPGSAKAVLTLASGEQVDLQKEQSFFGADSSEVRNANNILEYKSGNLDSRNRKTEYHLLTVPRGGEYHLKLADGSQVWLNSETQLKYPVVFSGRERRIYLEGEAYFEVAKDAGRPFVVSVGGVDVTALGTAFNISSGMEQHAVYATLVEGAVRVENEMGEACVLQPSQQAVCKKQEKQIEVQTVNTALYTSWKDGYYTFDRQTLGEIMRTLSRWYDTEVIFEKREAMEMRYSGRLKRYEKLSELLTMIKLTNDVDFEIREKTIIVN